MELREIIRYILINSNAGFSSLDNLKNFIKISHQALLKTIAAEAVLEDFLLVIKKAFEKHIIDFKETLRIIRKYSREMFHIKAYREKLIHIRKVDQ